MINNNIREISEIILLENDNSFTEFKDDEFFLEDVFLSGDILKINVSYNGGCKKHLFYLTTNKNFKQIKNNYTILLKLFHDSKGDSCKKIVTEKLLFNVLPLKSYFLQVCPDQNTISLELKINNIFINYKS